MLGNIQLNNTKRFINEYIFIDPFEVGGFMSVDAKLAFQLPA